MKTSEYLKQAKYLIDSPEKFTKGAYARDSKGKDCLIEDGKTFCSSGALCKADKTPGYTHMFEVLNSGVFGKDSIAFIKYSDTHTHAEVMNLWDKAIAAIEYKEKQNDC